jgi:hypothetical protein
MKLCIAPTSECIEIRPKLNTRRQGRDMPSISISVAKHQLRPLVFAHCPMVNPNDVADCGGILSIYFARESTAALRNQPYRF